MDVRKFLAGATIGAAVFLQGCLGEPARIFYDDKDTGVGDATIVADGETDTAGQDMSAQNEGAADGASDGSNEAADAAIDGARDSANDAGVDSAVDGGGDSGGVESGCGPTNTISNCGACGTACDTVHSTGAQCNGVSCLYSGCAAGWGDCVTTGPPNTDGCETQLNTVTNCTGCGLSCDSVHSTGRSCDGGSCGYVHCAPGYADCVTNAPNTDGCETAITTPTNCTGCGLACDTSHSAGAQCGASGCTYTGCSAGWTNCSTTAPDTAGCECNTPACCGTSCQTTHDNGVGNPYYDCVTQGTYSQAQAMKACTAYTGDAAQCVPWTCVTTTDGPIICSSGAMTKNCVCWSYAGNNIGYVDNGGAPPGPSGNTCYCPSTTLDPKWN
jgi:hypothetical protein